MPIRVLIVLGTTALLLAGPAWGQPRGARGQRLEELSRKLDELSKSAADGAAAIKAAQDLQEKLNALRKQVQKLRSTAQGYDEVRGRVLDYDDRLGNLELALAAIKMQLAGQGATTGYKDGFFIQSPDEKHLLRLNGLLQAGYEGLLYDREVDDTGRVLAEHESTFLLRRARIGASGHLLNWRLRYRIEFDFGQSDPGPVLEGWGELIIHRALKLRAGRQRIPLGRQFLVHAAYLQFINRTGVVDSFHHGWDYGVMLRGDLPLLGGMSYQAGVFNGSGSMAERDVNTDFLYVTRLLFQPLGPVPYAEGDTEVSKLKLAFGGAFSYNLVRTDQALRRGITDPAQATAFNDADSDGTPDNVGVYTIAAELTARLGGLALQNEFFYRIEDPGAVAPDNRTFWGLYSQASFYHFDSTLEAAVRYGYVEPNHYGVSRTRALPAKTHEVAGVINALTWGRRIKWQLEYTHRWLLDLFDAKGGLGQDLESNEFRVQMQLAF